MNLEPYRLCPRFDRCSVNACPLDPIQRFTHPADKAQKCPMEKQVRVRIAATFPGVILKNGLTDREWAAKQRFEALPLAVKTAMVQKGKEALLRHRQSKQR